ncbi:MAG: glycoside hydrolase family 5 protein [Myxococcaceae bacterium]|nr:glycoside hydrolase family 5 protein [Myxococcaceae bacterium]
MSREKVLLSAWLLPLVMGCGPEPVLKASLDWAQAPKPTAAPANVLPRLMTVGSELVNAASGVPVKLRGVNVCSLEFDRDGANWKLSATGSEVLKVLADSTRWKANVVRMPVNQQWFVEDDAYVQRVELLIDAANALGVYVILDVQWEVGQKLEPYYDNILRLPTFGEGNTTEAFWHKASARWSNRTNVLYDLINEPHDYPEGLTAQAMQALADAIRLRDTQVVLVIGGMNWGHTVDYYRQHPLSGGNLVYSAHAYLPYDGVDSLDDRFGNAAGELPVVVGEFLAEEANADYARALVERAEARGADGWLPWAIGCGFGENADIDQEPFKHLAQKMRELN